MTADPLPQGWSAALGPHAPPEARHPLDAHAWRIEAGDAALLFDAGAGLGPAPKAADALFLTHGHGDHALGAARLRLPTFSGPLTAEWLAAGDADRISLPKAIAAGVYPPGTRLAPLPGITAMADGETPPFRHRHRHRHRHARSQRRSHRLAGRNARRPRTRRRRRDLCRGNRDSAGHLGLLGRRHLRHRARAGRPRPRLHPARPWHTACRGGVPRRPRRRVGAGRQPSAAPVVPVTACLNLFRPVWDGLRLSDRLPSC